MIIWKHSVNLLVLLYVGGVFDVLIWLTMVGTDNPALSFTSWRVDLIKPREFVGHHASAINVFLAWSYEHRFRVWYTPFSFFTITNHAERLLPIIVSSALSVCSVLRRTLA